MLSPIIINKKQVMEFPGNYDELQAMTNLRATLEVMV